LRASVPSVDDITHVAIAAQRRRVAMPLGIVHAGKDVSHVPKAVMHCQVKQHETYADLLDDILAENHHSGRLAYSDASIMHLACMIVGLRPLITEVQLMRRLGFAPDVKGAKGKAQKFLRWAKVAAKFPNLRIG